MYIRFVVGTNGEHHRTLTGVITVAHILRDAGRLYAYEARRLQELYDWFNDNLPCPPFARRSWPRDAVCWFKDDAAEPLDHVWDVVALLKEHGVPVRMLRSECPGTILYEDEYQVVANDRYGNAR